MNNKRRQLVAACAGLLAGCAIPPGEGVSGEKMPRRLQGLSESGNIYRRVARRAD